MFETLQDKLSDIFKNLTSHGVLSKKDTDIALKEIKAALIEADVALPVIYDFIEKIRQKAQGAEIIRSIKPGQMIVKIVHEQLVNILGHESCNIDLKAVPPVPIMLVGLQGCGKTTTSAKLAKKLAKQHNKKILLASLDTYRPAAQEQLQQLARQLNMPSLEIVAKETPQQITKRAMDYANKNGFDIVIFDSAGRTHIDEKLMSELSEIKAIAKPHEILLVADSLTGQEAVNIAKIFHERLALTGIILTKIDGDGRGGAALSMKAVTNVPIKAMGVGEKLDDLEDFHPKRVADRILAMGDIVSLVEKAAENIDKEKAEALAKKLQKGKFDFDDLANQIKQMQKMGGMAAIMGMMPGLGKMKNQALNAGLDDKLLTKQLAIISSMTKEERKNPELLKNSRKIRIAKGSGTNAAEINKLIKMQRQMADMMKAMRGKGKMGFLKNMLGGTDMPDLSSLEGNFNNAPQINTNELTKLAENLNENKISNLLNKFGNFPGFPGKR